MTDKVLDLIQNSSAEIADLVGKSEDHGFLIIGVKLTEGETEDHDTVETVLDAGGYYGILAQGLFAELKSQLESDQPQLFAILRQVIRDLEEEFELEPDDDLGDNVEPTIH